VKIVVLVKQVPRPDSIAFDEETKQLKREGVPLELNPFDAAAVRHAVTLRDRAGGEVIAMTMGPPQAEAALRVCLALGADRCIHLSDRVFAVADTIGTSRTLSMAIAKEGADLVICGRKTVDSETWQVPPEVAAFLGWPHLTSVSESDVVGGSLTATREADDGDERYELPLPALLSLARADENVPEESGDGPIDVWTAADLVDDVRPNDKRFGQTGSPTRVLAVRDVTPPRAGLRVEDVDAAAELVKARLAETALPASEWEKPERLGEKPGHNYDAWTMVELVAGRPSRVSLELLGKSRELAGKLGGRTVALVLGSGLADVARELGRHGAERVVLVDDNRLAEYNPELYAAAVRQVLQRERPHVLAIPATADGRDYGPRAAGELHLGMTGDCVNLGIDRAGRLIQTKPAYGGNIVSVIMGATTPQLATVRTRMFRPLEPRDDAHPEISQFELDGLPDGRTRLLERRATPEQDGWKLDEADVVVLAGPGVGDAAIAELQRLADSAGAALGGTREVCAQGWLAPQRQVGLYGRPVAPRVLMAVEVPGDFEHLTGFVKAEVIAAIGSDSSAPMLGAADVALVGDWRQLLEPLLERLRDSL
jgi:electron transfer flavoprotein alpha subunit